MRSEKQQLIEDLLDDESRREATLLAGASSLRRRRHRRAAGRIVAVVILTAVAGLMVQSPRPLPTLAKVSPAPTKVVAPLRAQSLTDEQLLSLFPNTPVGLATLPNGKKLLIFPRQGDEARFVGRF
jgi:hypothetical protein